MPLTNVLGALHRLWDQISPGIDISHHSRSPTPEDEGSSDVMSFLSPSGRKTARTHDHNDAGPRRSRQLPRSHQASQLLPPRRGEMIAVDPDAVPVPMPGISYTIPVKKFRGPRPHNDFANISESSSTGTGPSISKKAQATTPKAKLSNYENFPGRWPQAQPPKRRKIRHEGDGYEVPESDDELAQEQGKRRSTGTFTGGAVDGNRQAALRPDAQQYLWKHNARRLGVQGSNGRQYALTVRSHDELDDDPVEDMDGDIAVVVPAHRNSSNQSFQNRLGNTDGKVQRVRGVATSPDVLDAKGPAEYSTVQRIHKGSSFPESVRKRSANVLIPGQDVFSATEIIWHDRQYDVTGMGLELNVQGTALSLRAEERHLPIEVALKYIREMLWNRGSTTVVLHTRRTIGHSTTIGCITFASRSEVARFITAISPRISGGVRVVGSFDKHQEIVKRIRDRCEVFDIEDHLAGKPQPKEVLVTSNGDSEYNAMLLGIQLKDRMQGRQERDEQDQRALVDQTLSDIRKPLFENNNVHLRRTRSTRQIAPEEEPLLVPDHLKYSKTHGLGPVWTQPLTYPASGKNRATVAFDDLTRLDEGEFLNDNLIDFYLRYLANQKPELAKRVYWFNTYFYNNLTSGKKGRVINYDAVRKWTRAVDIFDYDYVIVPINENVHWYVAIICNLPTIKRHVPVLENGYSPCTGSDEFGMWGAQQDSPNEEIAVLAERHGGAKDGSPVQGMSKSYEMSIQQMPLEGGPSLSKSEADMRMVEVVDNAQQSRGGASNLQDEPVTEATQQQSPQTLDKSGALVLSTRHDTSPTANTSISVKVKSLQEHIPSDATKNGQGGTSHEPVPAELHENEEVNLLDNVEVHEMEKADGQGKKKRRSGPPLKTYDPRQPAIVTLDSLGLAHSGTNRILKEYLRAEASDKRGGMEVDTAEISGLTGKGIPLQDNYCDCGLYLLGYMDKFVDDPEGFVTNLLQKSFDERRDWPRLDASNMRNELRELIMGLHEDQENKRRAGGKAKRSMRLSSGPTNDELVPPEAAPSWISNLGQVERSPKQATSPREQAENSLAFQTLSQTSRNPAITSTERPTSYKQALNQAIPCQEEGDESNEEIHKNKYHEQSKRAEGTCYQGSTPCNYKVSVVINSQSQNESEEQPQPDSQAGARLRPQLLAEEAEETHLAEASPARSPAGPATRGKPEATYSKKGKRRRRNTGLRSPSGVVHPEVIELDD